MTELERAMDQIREMAQRGWRITVDFDYGGDKLTVDEIRGWAGDCNCPYPKHYDPSDGHGWSTFDPMDDYKKGKDDQFHAGPVSSEWLSIVGEEGASFPAAVDFAYRHIMAIEPGAPYPKDR